MAMIQYTNSIFDFLHAEDLVRGFNELKQSQYKAEKTGKTNKQNNTILLHDFKSGKSIYSNTSLNFSQLLPELAVGIDDFRITMQS